MSIVNVLGEIYEVRILRIWVISNFVMVLYVK